MPVLEVNAADERVSLSIKALERPAQEEGEKQEKRCQSRPRRPNKKNVTLVFQNSN